MKSFKNLEEKISFLEKANLEQIKSFLKVKEENKKLKIMLKGRIFDKEEDIRNAFMQLEKERIIELYLGLRFERNYLRECLKCLEEDMSELEKSHVRQSELIAKLVKENKREGEKCR